jgi:hypothetical protein
MTDANHANFSARLREIDQRHKRLAAGYVRLEERNGLLVPVEGVKLRRGMPLRGISLALGMFLVFKGFLLAYLGPVTYANRVGTLDSGTIVEQMGGWIMRADPITHWIATQLNMLF